MEDKYCDLLTKVKADDAFKADLIAALEEKQQKHRTARRFSMKKTKWIAAAAAVMAVVACTGAALAVLNSGFGAKHYGVQFSDQYPDYVVPVIDQVIGGLEATGQDGAVLQTSGDGIQVALESSLCDTGFMDLQFRVKISEEKLAAYRRPEDESWNVPLVYLSFNDPVTENSGVKSVRLGGANYTLILDGEELWLRGRTAQSIEQVSAGEYVVQQLWFLDDSILDGKETFQVTLRDVAVGLGENCLPIDGEFNLTVSREKARQNTTLIELGENASWTRGNVTRTVEAISLTPLQNIVRIRTVYSDVSRENFWPENLDYLACSESGQAQATFSARIAASITYEDGVMEKLAEPGEYDFSRQDFEHAVFETVEIVATAPIAGSDTIVLKVYETDDRTIAVTNIADYKINLTSQTMQIDRRDVRVYDPAAGMMTDEYKTYLKFRFGQDIG